MENAIYDALIEELYDISSDDEVSDDHGFGFSDDDVDGEIYISVEQNTTHPKIDNFMEVVEKYDEVDFRAHFRLKRSTVNLLIDKYASSSYVPTSNRGGRSKIGAKKEILVFLWYVGNTVTFRQLGNLFGVSKSAAWYVVQRVSSWLVDNSSQYIKWPTGQEASEIMAAFEILRGIPGVLGVIDGSHIKIKAPKVNQVAYFNRKKYCSLVLQAVVGADKRFLDVYCGEPGSLHDSRVLRRSELFAKAESDQSSLFPNNSFLLGDSAYPHLPWIITPFKDNGQLTQEQINFNKAHSSTRIVVENAFGKLKGEFRRCLHFSEATSLNLYVNIIVACCVLHNICINEGDLQAAEEVWDLQVTEETEDAEDISQNTQQSSGNQRRQELFNSMLERGIV